jgi:flagellar biosynthesis protein FlhG
MSYADQADRLRRLVMDSAQSDAPAGELPLVVLTGAKGGVGVTTVAVNLSIALADRGLNVALVDANLHQPDIATVCGIQEKGTLQDALSGRRTIQEVLHRGPSGVQVVPGTWAPDDRHQTGRFDPQRLRGALRRLGAQADAIVVDAGSTPGPLAGACWRDARLAGVVTVPDTVSVMDAYATIKLHAVEVPSAGVHLLVNRGEGAVADDEVYQRIRRACERFLGLEVSGLPPIPDNLHLPQCLRPIAVEQPASPVAQAFTSLAEHVAQLLARRAQDRSADRAKLSEPVPSAGMSFAS